MCATEEVQVVLGSASWFGIVVMTVAVPVLVGCGDDAARSSAGGGQGAAASSSSRSDGAGAGGAGVTVQSSQTGAGGFEECTGISQQASTERLPADIIVLVDTSESMTEEAAALVANLNALYDAIVASGVDTHVVLLADGDICIPPPLGSGACDEEEADSNPPRFHHEWQFIESGDALLQVAGTYSRWREHLRPGASKTFLVVSDNDSPNMDAAEFTADVLALDPPMFEGFRFAAITALDDPLACSGAQCPQDNTCCYLDGPTCRSYAAAEGTVYQELAAQTGGVLGDLCTQEFTPIFDAVAEGVVVSTPIACTFEIPPPPEGEALDPGEVNVRFTPSPGADPIDIPRVEDGLDACGADGGWAYDDPDAPTAITVCPASCQVLQASDEGRVDVVFGCETIVAPPN